MVATSEQRIEEVHARIFEQNAGMGRSLSVPTCSARVCMHENLNALQSFYAKCFVFMFWNSRTLLPKILEPFDHMGGEFIKHGFHEEQLKAVYACLPRMMFAKMSDVTLSFHDRFAKAIKAPPAKIAVPLKMGLDYFKERMLTGSVFRACPKRALSFAIIKVPKLF